MFRRKAKSVAIFRRGTRTRAEMFARGGDVPMAEGEAGKKRARIDGTERRAAPVSPFVATPPSQHLAKILRVRHPCVRHGDDDASFARSRARAEPSEAPSSLESDRTRDSEFAGPSSPADAGLRTPSAPLLARRARASVASLSVCRVEQLETDASGCSTDSTIVSGDGDRRAERREDERRVRSASTSDETKKKTESARAAGTIENTEAVSNDEPCAYAYVPGTRMPSTGWMQRCFGCGTWTGQAVRLGAFEVFRCNACARQFRRRAEELKASARAGDATLCPYDDAADKRKHRGGCHRRAASAESNELTGLASRLREFLLARCPDAGLEHSIANHTA